MKYLYRQSACASKLQFKLNLTYRDLISAINKLPVCLSYIINRRNNMSNKEANILNLVPPCSVRNMTVLDRDAFQKAVLIPSIRVPMEDFSFEITKKFKNYLLKVPKLKSVRSVDTNDEFKEVLLNPALIKSQEDVKTTVGIDLDKINGNFSMTEVTLTYDNWKCDEILKAVLPENLDTCASYSNIGHILSLNLREHLLPYKTLIGQVYLDKISHVSLVVNKADIIDNSDNTFRSFAMEKLAGETSETVATVKENNCTFKFDFSKVYWNPRLSTEHERIVNKLKTGDVLFDVMAGVGPFAIPAAKKKHSVFANDLNPASFEALKENCIINKVSNYVQCFNMDGKDFIKTVIKEKLLIYLIDKDFKGCIHLTMNLPSISVDFLPAFIGLLSSDVETIVLSMMNINEMHSPVMHVYLFSLNETTEFAAHKVASKLGYCFSEVAVKDERDVNISHLKDNIMPEFWENVIEIVNVRKVAPAKVMFRVTFRLPVDVLFKREVSKEMSETKCEISAEMSQQKKLKLDTRYGTC